MTDEENAFVSETNNFFAECLMRKSLSLFLLAIFLVSSVSVVPADALYEPGWQISVENSHITGQFDYILHYTTSDSSQVISRVSMPQNQEMLILNGIYSFPDGQFVQLQYGDTDFNNKGRGSDSDWENPGSGEVTSYGEMDFYGRQTVFSIDVGETCIDNSRIKVNLFIGYGEQSSTNEIRNVVYHLDHGTEVGNQAQDDNGSSLDLKLSGFHFGTSGDVLITDNLIINLGLILSVWNARADGLWNNYDPAWDWVDNGKAIGYTTSLGLKYSFTNSLSASAGYFYNYAEADGCSEVLNGSTLSQAVDLKYETQGYKLGISYRF